MSSVKQVLFPGGQQKIVPLQPIVGAVVNAVRNHPEWEGVTNGEVSNRTVKLEQEYERPESVVFSVLVEAKDAVKSREDAGRAWFTVADDELVFDCFVPYSEL